jgi:hypothetical protein
MTRERFLAALREAGDAGELRQFCRRNLLHGTPYVFSGREGEYFDFRTRIAERFELSFHEVFIVGSAKLGFSPHKATIFDLDSDIDVVLLSQRLFDDFMEGARQFQGELRRSRRSISTSELKNYHKFLEYTAMGWIRPDKLPQALSQIKEDWFSFFRSISHGASEAGNYKVAAGIFRSYYHLEQYLVESLQDVYQSLAF